MSSRKVWVNEGRRVKCEIKKEKKHEKEKKNWMWVMDKQLKRALGPKAWCCQGENEHHTTATLPSFCPPHPGASDQHTHQPRYSGYTHTRHKCHVNSLVIWDFHGRLHPTPRRHTQQHTQQLNQHVDTEPDDVIARFPFPLAVGCRCLLNWLCTASPKKKNIYKKKVI